MKLKKIATIGLVVIAMGVTGFFSWKTLSQPNAQEVFNQMQANNLSTTKFTVAMNTENGRTTTHVDVSDVSNPKVATTISVDSKNDLTTKMQYFSTFKDEFVKYSPVTYLGAEIDSVENEQLADKWVQLRKDDKLVKGASQALYQLGDANLHLFNGTVMGNFNATDKKALLDFIKEKPLYDFGNEAAKSEELFGRKVLVYKVALNNENLLEFNKKVGDIVGVQPKYLEDRMRGDETATYYVDLQTKRPLRVVSAVGGTSVTTDISFGKATIPNMPVPQLEIAKLVELITAIHENYEYTVESPAPVYSDEQEAMQTEDMSYQAPEVDYTDNATGTIGQSEPGTLRLE